MKVIDILIEMTNIIFDKSLHNDQNADGKLRADVPVNKAPAQTGGGKNRIQYVDLAKGFGIMIVVVYHIFYHLHNMPAINIISIFMLPLFFFLSGMFFKEHDSFFGFLVKKINTLLIPFAFFYLITSIALPNILHAIGFKLEHADALGKISSLWAFITKESFSNEPLWFLWSFFLLNLYFYIIVVPFKKMTSNSKVIAFSIIFFSSIIGFVGTVVLAGPPRINIPGFADSAMSALPFFAIGYLLNKYTDIFKQNKYDKFLPLVILLCFVLVFYVGGKCSYKQNVYHINPILQYFCGMAGVFGVIFSAKMLGSLPFITYWGRYSLMILVTHALLLQAFMPLVRKFMAGLPQFVIATVVLMAVMFSYQLLIPLMKRFLPYFTAQKDLIKIPK